MSDPGSSPRMRGAQRALRYRAFHSGIIPADAGSTPLRLPTTSANPDHPRGCGEHDAFHDRYGSAEGSSPRMRGAPLLRLLGSLLLGIIPADAGSTRVFSINMRSAGSSPRMRGAPWRRAGPCTEGRIIPADAGSTLGRGRATRRCQDHPRGCGEHNAPLRVKIGNRGSSPRMRGALWKAGGLAGRQGIIPADAGSTRTCL